MVCYQLARQSSECARSLSQARAKIAQRGREIGLDFDGEVAALEGGTDWEAELRGVQNPNLAYPAYYTQPFHAYSDGNLCWEAALQVLTCLESPKVNQLS